MNFNWTLFFESSPDGDGIYFYWLLNGLMLTLSLAICAWIIAFIFGSIIGIFRSLENKWLKKFAVCYIELFRNIPLLVQMFIWFTLVPQTFSGSFGIWYKQTLDPQIQMFVMLMIALGLFTSARIAEQVRTGLQTLPAGQKYAAYALGLTKKQTYIYVLLPNAYRKIIPTLASEMTNIIKNSSVAGVIGLYDLSTQIVRINDKTNSIIEVLCGVALAYALANYFIIYMMRYVERKARLPNMMNGG